jgi:hypothetical protein
MNIEIKQRDEDEYGVMQYDTIFKFNNRKKISLTADELTTIVDYGNFIRSSDATNKAIKMLFNKEQPKEGEYYHTFLKIRAQLALDANFKL